MDASLWQEHVLYKRRINHYNDKHSNVTGDKVTLDSILELTTIIPENLVSGIRIKLTPFINIENNFEDVISYLNWLDSLTRTIEKKEYFTTEQLNVLVEHRVISLEAFLTDSRSMMYFPYVIIENIRSKVMKLKRVLDASTRDCDLHDYYQRRIKGFTLSISQPVFAIGEMAALKYE